MTLVLPEPTIQLLPEERPPWRVVFGALLVGVVLTALTAQAAVLAELSRDKVWLASSEVEFRDPNLLPETVSATFKSPSIWHPVAEREGLTDKEFLDDYAVEVAGGGTQIIRVTFQDTDTSRAKRVVQGVVEIYMRKFTPRNVEPALEILTSHLAALEILETDLLTSLQNPGDTPRDVQIDQQNQLTKVRQQITSVLFRMDQRESERLVGRDVEPRIITNAFVAEEPVTPSPAKALVFGTAAGGLVAVGAIYLTFHRTAQRGSALGGSALGGSALGGSALGGSALGGSAFGGSALGGQVVTNPTSLDVPIGSRKGRLAKRSLDVVVSLTGLVLLSPLLLLMAIAVWSTSRGGAIFRQERIGRFGQPFIINKFRTMKVNNDDSEHRGFVEDQLKNPDSKPAAHGTYKLADARVTKLGSILRRGSLDELPQLWNVLKGDMSLVGPRPPLRWEWELFGPVHRRRDRAVPGCTGLWQVSGRNLMSSMEMLDLDVEYVDYWSFRQDFWILVRTPLTVLRGDGAR